MHLDIMHLIASLNARDVITPVGLVWSLTPLCQVPPRTLSSLHSKIKLGVFCCLNVQSYFYGNKCIICHSILFSVAHKQELCLFL